MLSLVTVVYNEEARLPGMLDWHLPWVDESVVVHDGPCDDRTLELALQRRCIVVVAPEHLGYCEPLRALGASRASGDWILFVDADERFPIEVLTLARQLSRDAAFDAVMLPRTTVWPDDLQRPPVQDFQVRLLRKEMLAISPVIHTSPTTTGRLVRFDWPIQHVNYAADVTEKKDRYRQIIQSQLALTSNPDVTAHLQRCLQEMDG